jgi:hypothetical protein
MGDAVLGKVALNMRDSAPPWSDPQIKVDHLSLRQQAKMAEDIYRGYGRWSSVCSAIVCWALIVAL